MSAIIVNYLGISFSLPLLGALWTLVIPVSGLPFLYFVYRFRRFPLEDWKRELVSGMITLYIPLLIHGLIYWSGVWPTSFPTTSPEQVLEVEKLSIPAPFIGVGLIIGLRWIGSGMRGLLSRKKDKNE
jgi:hypothetical protein